MLFAPFGEIRAGDLSELTDKGYTGQRLDRSADGLMYYNARYYLPELKRFISADTVVPNPANPQALNRFSYVENNPVNAIDPSGHSLCKIPTNCETRAPAPTPPAATDAGCGKLGCGGRPGGGKPSPGRGGGSGHGGGTGGRGGAPDKGGTKVVPTPDEQPGSPAVTGLLDELAQYGVFVQGLSIYNSVSDQISALMTILYAVAANGNQFSILLGQIDNVPISPYAAFRALMGPITIFSIVATLGPNRNGENSRLFPRAGTSSGLDRRGFVISVTSATLLRDGPWDGVQLVAHELAHNLTWQGGNTGEITGNRYWDFFAMDSSTGGAAEFRNTYAGVLAGDYSDVLWYEVSADIIASWVLDDWRGEPNLSIVDQFIRCSVLYTCSVPHE